MFAVTAATSAALATAGWAQNPQAWLSWNLTCPTVVTNMNFTTAQVYSMYEGLKNVGPADANVGTDTQIFYGPNIPDAWRMDDAGCQTGSQVTFATKAASKACPVMLGPSSLTITNLFYDATGGPAGQGRMNIRLSVTYDTFTPVAGTSYTLWELSFDHSFSVTGAGSPPTNCGGAELPICFSITNTADSGTPSFLLNTSNIQEPFTFAQPSDQFVTWNSASGCPGSVPTQPSTWGRLKGLYH
jgi:hypothetical protein